MTLRRCLQPCVDREGIRSTAPIPAFHDAHPDYLVPLKFCRCYVTIAAVISTLTDLEPAARQFAVPLIRLLTGEEPTGEEPLMAIFEWSLLALEQSGFTGPLAY